MENVKIGFLEICLMSGIYLYGSNFYISTGLILIAVLGTFAKYLIKKSEERETKKSIEKLIQNVANTNAVSNDNLNQIKTYGSYEN